MKKYVYYNKGCLEDKYIDNWIKVKKLGHNVEYEENLDCSTYLIRLPNKHIMKVSYRDIFEQC